MKHTCVLQSSCGSKSDYGLREQRWNPTAGSCIHHNSYRDSLGRGLHTLTAVSRSTQPSNIRVMVKRVSAFRMNNNNKWWWWVWIAADNKWTHTKHKSVGLICVMAATWSCVCTVINWIGKTLTMAMSLYHEDSTINTAMVTIIITPSVS